MGQILAVDYGKARCGLAATDDMQIIASALQTVDTKTLPDFLRKYFSLKHQAGLKTQAEVGKAAGLERTQITVLESGEHMPQQKTLQKLAKAFGVDVTDLM